MERLRAVVVEDQPLTRAHIVSMLERLDVDVVESCPDGAAAAARIPAAAPDVVFLDVELPEMSGFDVIEAIGIDAMPPVVFITAYDGYALRALDLFASGYLLKPVAPERLERVVERLKARAEGTPARLARNLSRLLAEPALRSRPDRLVLRRGERLVPVSAADIEWIEASGNYAILHVRGERFDTRQPMHALQRRFAGAFVRIHRSALVNVARIAEVRTTPDGDYDVVTTSGRVLRVARRFRRLLEERLRQVP